MNMFITAILEDHRPPIGIYLNGERTPADSL